MDEHNIVLNHKLSQLHFRLLTDEDKLKLSVKEVTNTVILDCLNLLAVGGLGDPALGSTKYDDECSTCGQSGRLCNGHFGHIVLPQPVFSPVLFPILVKLLRGTCLCCYKLYMSDIHVSVFCHQMVLLRKGYVVEAKKFAAEWKTYTGYGRIAGEMCDEDCDRDSDHEGSVQSNEDDNVWSKKQTHILKRLNKFCHRLMGNDTDAACFTRLSEADMQDVLRVTFSKLLAHTPKKCKHCGSATFSVSQEYNSQLSATRSPSCFMQAPNGQTDREDEWKVKVEPSSASQDTALYQELLCLFLHGADRCLITPLMARRMMRIVWRHNRSALKALLPCLPCNGGGDAEHPTDVFFVTTLLVPPNIFRPATVLGERVFENTQSASFRRILSTCQLMHATMRDIFNVISDKTVAAIQNDLSMMERLQTQWVQLQTHVNALIDSDLDRVTLSANKVAGIRQDLEKKEGKFRMNMMGKRVNFACRSVISPDFNITTNEIGIPEVFAKKLTYPQYVTPWNVHDLRQNVINGPDEHPGATAIVNEDGSVVKLNRKSLYQREAVAKELLTTSSHSGIPKQVLRHLKDGDFMLLNRQPTLHRPSMQAHKARILKGEKTLRLHYSNCKAYNADFDGDEMNAHFPQSEMCRAEACMIASTDFQYLVPKNGCPLAGLIQDHIVGGVLLTVRGQFFCRGDYLNLLQTALSDFRGSVHILPPSILKPQVLWSGKQIISSLLLNLIPKGKVPLCLEGSSNVKEKSWVQHDRHHHHHNFNIIAAQQHTEGMGESTIVVKDGELLQGIIDKAHCGPSPYGLVHSVYELYGGPVAGQLLTSLGRLFTATLKIIGFSLGVEDVIVRHKADKKRRSKISESSFLGADAVRTAFGVGNECTSSELLALWKEAHFSSNHFKMKQLDMCVKKDSHSVADDISANLVGRQLRKAFPGNSLQLMVQSGAKGSSVNCLQISSMLGQIELEGRRPPLMPSGRSLPLFEPYDMSYRAGGFATDRFLSGVRPAEMFFHCMAGREGLVDTAVKTSRSGYLQRCLVKHMEGLKVNYDMTVRDSDGSVVQFLYGEDGLDVCKTSFLEERHFPFLLKNCRVVDLLDAMSNDDRMITRHKHKVKKWQWKHEVDSRRSSPFLDFCQKRGEAVASNCDSVADANTGRSTRDATLIVEWRSLKPETRNIFKKKRRSCPDPVLSKFWPQCHLGVISEKLEKQLDRTHHDFCMREAWTSNSAGKIELQKYREVLNRLIYHKAMRSMCEPGEAVGMLCAQSIGEPSTQMTLNTFHFAGRGEMNVTLGIPRLREILMMASSSIKTPAMEVPVIDTPEARAAAELLLKRFQRISLHDVIEKTSISDYLEGTGRENVRVYCIQFFVLPTKSHNKGIKMRSRDVVLFLRRHFVPAFLRRFKNELRKLSDKSLETVCQRVERQSSQPIDDSMDLSPVDESTVDASMMNVLLQGKNEVDYIGEEEEKFAVGDMDEGIEKSFLEESDFFDGGVSAIVKEEADGSSNYQAELSSLFEQPKKGAVSELEKELNCEHSFDNDDRRHWCSFKFKFKSVDLALDPKPIVDDMVRTMILHQVPGIKRGMLNERDEGGTSRLYLVTEGVNIQEMMRHGDVVDFNRLYTNSIGDILRTFGVEAASKVIIREVQQVFKPYNIQVNGRHLTLLADYMTCDGAYKGFNRAAMASNPSPLQKVTFETCMHFLSQACLNSSPDDLQSPSSRVVAGRFISTGTGSFDILQPLTG